MQEKLGSTKDFIHNIECETEKIYVCVIVTKFWCNEICVCYN